MPAVQLRESPSGPFIPLNGFQLSDPLSRELFVDPVTAVPLIFQNGSMESPFILIADALAEAAAIEALAPGPITIWLAAGEYSEAISLGVFSNLAIIGQGGNGLLGQTIWRAPAASTFIFQCAPAAGDGASMLALALVGIDFDTAGVAGQRAIDVVSSTFSPSTMLAGGLSIEGCSVNGTPAGTDVLRVTGIGKLRITDGELWGARAGAGARVFVENVSDFIMSRSFYDVATFTWESASPVPGAGRFQYFLDDVTADRATTINGHPVFFVTSGSLGFGGVSINGVLTANGAAGPFLNFNGCGVFGSTTLAFPNLAGVAGVGYRFQDAYFFGTVAVSVTAGATRLPVTAADGRFAFYRTTVTSGDLVDFNIRGASFQQENLVCTGSGTIDRDRHVVTGADTALDPSAAIVFGNTANGTGAGATAVPFPAAVTGANGYAAVAAQVTGTAVAYLVPAATKLPGSVVLEFLAAEGGRTHDVVITRAAA